MDLDVCGCHASTTEVMQGRRWAVLLREESYKFGDMQLIGYGEVSFYERMKRTRLDEAKES